VSGDVSARATSGSLPAGVAQVLDRALAERPDAVAVVARSGSLTYRELDDAAARAVGVLRELGVRPGDRVAASLPNDLDVVVAFHGVMRTGAIWVGVNAPLAPAEKAALLADCGAEVLLADAMTAGQVEPLRDRLPLLDAVVLADSWSQLLTTAAPAPSAQVDPHAPAGIAYTSGTTGLPRGIVHSQHNLLLPGAVLVAERGYDPSLRKGDCLPLTILNMMVLTTLLTAQAGGCCVVMDRRDAAGIGEWVREQQVTVWNGVPAQLFDLVRGGQVTREDLASLREVWSGGGDCPDALRTAFAEVFGHELRATYGLTEAPTVVAMDPVGGAWVPGASGRPLPHLLVRARDEDGRDVAPDGVGEICVSAAPYGPWAGAWRPMLGEWHDGAVLPFGDEVLRTGDLGAVDADGWLHVRDRVKLVVVRGGANVYPAEVERVLLTVPGVEAAAVFGVPDERLGQRVAALVQLRGGATVAQGDLVAACRAHLASYKVPERWAVVPELPRNAMGKVVRPALPDLLAQHARSD
jgi:acyl-CoA synthetase (AMP-forming)/AMP-acid ligase II